jgi:site-specific recombinase XerD
MQKRHTFSTLPFIRSNKKNDQGQVPIYVRITINGKPAELSTKIYIDPKIWISEKGKVKGNTEEARTINHTITVLESKAREAYNYLLEKGKLITALAIKNVILGISQKKQSLLTIFEKHTAELGERVGIDYSKATFGKYQTTLKYLKEFIYSQYAVEDVFFGELDHQFICNFEFFLKTKCNCLQNSTIKHIQKLRKVVDIAISNGWLEKDPFHNYSIKQEKTSRDYLTEEELATIVEKEFRIERLQIVKDIFIFSCYTGLAYVDIQSLTEDHLRMGIDGEVWIFTQRQKSNTPSNIPLLAQAAAIIEKYKNHPTAKNRYRLLPVPSNQKLNAYLKEIGDICGIKKNLTMHMGRHTFATTITLTNNVPIETVSKMLGHTSLKTTQIYAKVVEKKVSEDMKALKERLNLKQHSMKKAAGN